jgi:biotin transporter BioY
VLIARRQRLGLFFALLPTCGFFIGFVAGASIRGKAYFRVVK